MKRKILLLLSCLLLACTISACGSNTVDEPVNEASSSDSKIEAALDIMTNEEKEAESEEVIQLPDTLSSSNLFVKDNIAYFIGDNIIMSMDRTSGENKTIWKADNFTDNMYAFSGGRAILLGNNIYFFRNIEDSNNVNEYSSSNYLCRVSTDGTGYEELIKYPADNYCVGSMYYRDNILFVDGNGSNDCYRIDSDGNITETISRNTIESYAKVPEGYSLVSYNNNGYQLFFPEKTMAESNHLILQNKEFDFVNYDISTGREATLGGYIACANQSKLLIQEYSDPNQIYGTIDIKSGEYTFLYETPDTLNVYAMDDKYAYFVKLLSDVKGDIAFLRMDITNGKIEDHYNTKASDSALDIYPYFCFPTVFDGEYIYTVGSDNYAMYLKAINVADKKEVLSKDAFYDTGISQVGRLVYDSNTITSDSGDTLAKASVYTLNVDEKFAGASKINAIMNDEAKETLDSLENIRDEVTEWYNLTREDGGYFASYDYSMTISDIKYFDGNILSFDVERYDFTGGAHGMPYNEGYTFDLNTGDRLTLGDIVTLSEEELKDTITKAFAKMINENGAEYYWDDATTTIHEMFGFDSDYFYFTKNGVVFYCLPYDIASYAQGFQYVTIPYSELGINL